MGIVFVNWKLLVIQSCWRIRWYRYRAFSELGEFQQRLFLYGFGDKVSAQAQGHWKRYVRFSQGWYRKEGSDGSVPKKRPMGYVFAATRLGFRSY